ncbi:hypothetical protein [Roseibium album]|uniref:hypothetical protein n=1 Tax=Roseibium album TaxID=311410 RepID=UPI0024906C40|nr:hypothetical protein [Roseibium album]
MERINTTAETFTSAEWEPTGDVTIQFEPADRSTLHIEARAEPNAPWEIVRTIQFYEDPIVKLTQLPWLRLSVENPLKGTVKAWSDT